MASSNSIKKTSEPTQVVINTKKKKTKWRLQFSKGKSSKRRKRKERKFVVFVHCQRGHFLVLVYVINLLNNLLIFSINCTKTFSVRKRYFFIKNTIYSINHFNPPKNCIYDEKKSRINVMWKQNKPGRKKYSLKMKEKKSRTDSKD